MKTLDTLVEDIYDLLDPDTEHTVSEENLDLFAEACKDIFRTKLSKQDRPADRPIRFSALGKPDRQVWMDAHPDPEHEEKLIPKTYIKFLYGDLIEQLILFLAREAGHTVESCQEQVETDGVTGSIDAIVDGVVIDVKSASAFGFKKFEDGSILDNDPFGYVKQLAGYANILTPGKDAAWLANDKVHGDIVVTPLKADDIAKHPPGPRINHLKEVVAKEGPPPLCYNPEPDGKSGNMKLPTGCSYCRHKHRCHPNLRTFLYSTGPRYLTRVVKEPNVRELGGAEFPDVVA